MFTSRQLADMKAAAQEARADETDELLVDAGEQLALIAEVERLHDCLKFEAPDSGGGA